MGIPDIRSYVRNIDLPFLRNEEEIRLPPRESGILDIPLGSMGIEIQEPVDMALMDYNILPRTHVITSDIREFPKHMGLTRVDIKGLSKRQEKGEPIMDANTPKMITAFKGYGETFGIIPGAVAGGGGSNSTIVADANKKCGRSTLVVLSTREENPTANELKNLEQNIKAFKTAREEWNDKGMMEAIKPEPTYALARDYIGNFIFTANLASAQLTSNTSDYEAMVDENAFAILMSVKVKTSYNTTPSHLYGAVKDRATTLIKEGYLEKCATSIYPYFFGPADVLEDKETLVMFVQRAFVDAGIDVKRRIFEPVIAYNHEIRRRDLFLHTMIPVNIEACFKRVTGYSIRRRKHAR